MDKFEIVFYKKGNGIEPVKDFILSLDVKERAKILSILTILEENGYELREPYSKYLGSNIFELRIKTYKNAVRVLYFFYQDKKIVLTNAFSKKTNKTPKKEIELAKKRKSEYEKRSSE